MKFLLFFILALNSLFAFEKDYAFMQSLLDRQTTLAVAINRFIEDRGTVPTSIAVLRSANYLPQVFNDKNPFTNAILTYSIVGKRVKINSNSNLARLKQDERDYYRNTYTNREFARLSFEESNDLVSYYALSNKSVVNLSLDTFLTFISYKGDIDPILYTSPSNGAFWFSSRYEYTTYEFYFFNSSSWRTLESTNQNLTPSGTLENMNTITLIKSYWDNKEVLAQLISEPPTCDSGTYNPILKRCEGYTSNACGNLSFSTGLNKCTLSASTLCQQNGYSAYDGAGQCYNTLVTGANTTSVAVNCSHTCVWFNDILASGAFGCNGMAIHTIGGGSICGTNQTDTWSTPHCTGETVAQSMAFQGSCANNPDAPTSDTVWWTAYDTQYYCDGGWSLSGTLCYAQSGTSITNFLTSGQSVSGNYVTSDPLPCNGRTMPVTPFYPTPYYGNNGVCYSEAALFCNQGGVSWDGIYMCFNNSQHCNSATSVKNPITELCEKQVYSCLPGYNRYGLAEHSTNSNSTDLFNRITDKDNKLNTVAAMIINGNLIVDDNNGSMCTKIDYSTLTQPIKSPTYTITGQQKSGF